MKGKLFLNKKTLKVLNAQQNILGGKVILGIETCACLSQQATCEKTQVCPLPQSCVCPGSLAIKLK